LIKLVEFSKRFGHWLILVGHKIKESDIQSTSISVLEKLCEYSQNPANGIWVEKVEKIAKYIQKVRQESHNQF
jgi:hypothetical protein